MEKCAICLEAMAVEDVLALPCGHLFHERCIADGELRIGFDGQRIRHIRHPRLERCPLCRQRWSLPGTQRVAELSWAERALVPRARSLPWQRYRDPATDRIYWVNGDASDCFWEDEGTWKPYVFAERKWWCCDRRPETWFYADTGAAA